MEVLVGLRVKDSPSLFWIQIQVNLQGYQTPGPPIFINFDLEFNYFLLKSAALELPANLHCRPFMSVSVKKYFKNKFCLLSRLQCLRGSCCRDQRPLAARLGPIIYPQDLISIYGFGGFGGNGFGFSPGIGGFGGLIPGGLIPGGFGGFGGGFGGICFDTALNCFSYVAYCVVPIYRVIK